MTKEMWKDIPGYSMYQISNLGKVRSLKYQKVRLLKPGKTKSGYLIIRLSFLGVLKTFYVHRLVWETFNGQIYKGMQVNHINEIKTDNRLDNLNLLSPKDNLNWGTAQERRKKTMIEKHRHLTEEHKLKLSEARKKAGQARKKAGHTDYRVKIVQQYDLEGNLLNEYCSISEAARKTGHSKSAIWNSCKNNFKFHKQFTWKFK